MSEVANPLAQTAANIDASDVKDDSQDAIEIGAEDNNFFMRTLESQMEYAKTDDEKRTEQMQSRTEQRRSVYIPPEERKHSEWLLDTIAIHFHVGTYLKHLYCELFPFFARTLTPCIIKNWFVLGYNFLFFWKYKVYIALFFVYMVPFAMMLLILVPIIFNAVDTTFTPDEQNHLYLACVMPLIFFVLRASIVSAKYASMSPTEYKRLMNCSTFQESNNLQSQTQILSAWYFRRSDILLLQEAQAAAALIGLEMRQIFFTVENPHNSAIAKYLFMQWQAMLLHLPTIEGMSEKLDPRLTHVMKQNKKGDYLVFADDVAMGMLVWIENISNAVNDASADASLGVTSKFTEYLKKSVESSSHRNTAVDLVGKVQIIVLITMAFLPLILLNNHEITTSNGRIAVWLIFLFGLPLFGAGMLVFRLNLILARDTNRRIYEAHLLAEMMRTSEFVHDFKFLDLAKNTVSRVAYLENSVLSEDMLPLSASKEFLDHVKGVYDDDTSVAAKSVTTKNMAGKSKLTVGESSDQGSVIESLEDGGNIGEDVLPSKASNWKDVQSEKAAIARVHYFATRMPKLSVNVGERSNLMAWMYIRSMFRHSGRRFKFRGDLLAVMIFIVFATLFALTLGLQAGAAASPAVAQINAFFLTSPLFFQIVIGIACTATGLLINIATAAQANVEYSAHGELLSRHIVEVEAAFCKISDAALLHDAETTKRLAKLRDYKDSLELAVKSMEQVDQQNPLTILSIPATWGLFSTVISVSATLTVSLVGLYTKG